MKLQLKLLSMMLLILVASCSDKESIGSYSFTKSVTSLTTETSILKPVEGKIKISRDKLIDSEIKTTFSIEGGSGFITINQDILYPGDSFSCDDEQSFTYTPTNEGVHKLTFTSTNSKYTQSAALTINVVKLIFDYELNIPDQLVVDKIYPFIFTLLDNSSSGITDLSVSFENIEGQSEIYLNDKPFTEGKLKIGANNLGIKASSVGSNKISFTLTDKYGHNQKIEQSFETAAPNFSATFSEKAHATQVSKEISFLLNITEPEVHPLNEISTSYRFLSGSGILKINSEETSSGSIKKLKKGDNILSFKTPTAGITKIEFSITNNYGKSTKDTIIISATELGGELITSINQKDITCQLGSDANISLTISEENYIGLFSLKYTLLSGSGVFKVKDHPLGNGLSTTIEKGEHVIVFTPAQQGQSSFKIEISDSKGQKKEHTITVSTIVNSYTITATATEGGTVSGGGSFVNGNLCTLTAVAKNGYRFVEWIEVSQKVSSDNPYRFTVNKNRSLLAKFEKNNISASVDKSSQTVKVGEKAKINLTIAEDNYQGTFTVRYNLISGSGVFEGGNEQIFAAGTHGLTFTPTEIGSSTFSLTITDSNNSQKVINCTVIASANPIEATVNKNNINIEVGESSGEIILNVSENDYSGKFDLSYTVLDASAILKINNSELQPGLKTKISSGQTKLNFVVSEVGSSKITINVEDERGQIVHVPLKITASAIITATATEGGTVSGGGTFNEFNAHCSLSAIEKSGFEFVAWLENGIKISTLNPYTFKVENNRNITAQFEGNEVNITLHYNSNKGTIRGGGIYKKGEQVTLTATPNNGFIFSGFKVNGSGNIILSNPYSFTAKDDIVIEGIFDVQTFNITTTATEGGSLTGGGRYNVNTVCNLNATALPNYILEGIYKNNTLVTTNALYSFTVTEDALYSAKFRNLYGKFKIETRSEDNVVVSINQKPIGIINDNETLYHSHKKGETANIYFSPEDKNSDMSFSIVIDNKEYSNDFSYILEPSKEEAYIYVEATEVGYRNQIKISTSVANGEIIIKATNEGKPIRYNTTIKCIIPYQYDASPDYDSQPELYNETLTYNLNLKSGFNGTASVGVVPPMYGLGTRLLNARTSSCAATPNNVNNYKIIPTIVK